MDTRLTTVVTDLHAGQLLKVRRATGALLAVESGAVWVTEAGWRADAVLPVGASYRLGRGRAVAIEAIGATRLVIRPLHPVAVRIAPPGLLATVGRRILQLLKRTVAGPRACADR